MSMLLLDEENIEPFYITKLTDVIDEEVLRMIQTGFSELHGVPATIIEKRKDGWHRIDPITSNQNYCEFCKYLRGEPNSETDMECVNWDFKKADEAVEKGNIEPYWLPCHMNLVDVIFPIVIGGRTVAVFFSGQKRYKGKDNEIENRAELLSHKYKKLKLRRMMKLLKKMEIVTESDIDIFMNRLEQLVEHITKLGESNYAVKNRLQEEFFLKELSSYFDHEYDKDINPLWVGIRSVN